MNRMQAHSQTHSQAQSVGAVFSIALAGLLGLAAPLAAANPIELTAKDLYQGLEARKVLLQAEGPKLTLDARVFKFGKERAGTITTDPIDLGPADGIIGLPAEIATLDVEVKGEAPDASSIAVEVRTGAHSFDQSAWAPWQKLGGLTGAVKPAGRYAQVRIVLASTQATNLPSVTALVLKPASNAAPAPAAKPLKVRESAIQKIVNSPIVFHYERPDNPALVKMRKEARLDAVVAGARDDFEKLVKLMDWASQCHNVRGSRREFVNNTYAWDLDKVFSVDTNGTCHIYGHCMSYCEVLVSAASAMGYVSARHYSIRGFKEASHEVPDIWVPSLGKWVYFDPSLSNYYFDKDTKAPLNILEMHKIVIDTFLPEGKDMNWFADRGNQESRALVKRIGGKTPIGGRLGPGKYGEPMPADYDWGWSHGYLAAGFIQMTPRNDFHSHPDKASKNFQNYPGYDGFPFWVDEKTPPTRGGHNWYTRSRDFYWTLDQASIRLVRSADGAAVDVELGQSMPFFKSYVLKIDGQEATPAAGRFAWKLKPGNNQLTVAPVDEFGKIGLSSSVTLEYGP